MTEWNDFYVAVAGASAALTGLIFVGVSISLQRILAIRGLPDRALLSLVLLLNVLVLSLLFLVPGIAVRMLGILVLSIGAVVWFIVFVLDVRNFRSKPQPYKRRYLVNQLIDQAATILFMVTGLGMTLGSTGYVCWIVPAVLLSIIKAVVDAWVLLVEINR